MWVVISGPPGTSKAKIAEFLTSSGYEYKDWCTPVDHRLPSPERSDGTSLCFKREMLYFLTRLKIQLQICKIKRKKDIVTIRSTWESIEVYASVLLSRAELSADEHGILRTMYDTMLETMEPPDAFISIEVTEKMPSYNRMLLENKEVSEEYFCQLIDAYKVFMDKLATPVIEVQHNHVIDEVLHQVDFGLQSIKTGGLAEDTIWKKEIFK